MGQTELVSIVTPYIVRPAFSASQIFFDDPNRLLEAVSRLTNLHEPGRTPPIAWPDGAFHFGI
ncbi:hypothetical protein [Bradyrhizobium sp. ARR65]|uniref:hypothetical protein n=1 Tax=Bradyrhizobium sp. ARR65 TaxID=1040989 RepID=UPI0005558560|nr:hypothetical protein [Bradyrhizobium sp. ARR65]